MNAKHSPFLIACLLALTVSCSLLGCSYAYDCEISGKVLAFLDGTPMEGVRVTLTPLFIDGIDAPVTSGPDGSFLIKDRVADIHFDDGDRWTLTLSKEGFADQIIEIDPPSIPDRGGMNVRIVVAAYMKAN